MVWQRGQARAAARRARKGRGQQTGDLPEFGTGVADGGGNSIEALAGVVAREGQGGLRIVLLAG